MAPTAVAAAAAAAASSSSSSSSRLSNSSKRRTKPTALTMTTTTTKRHIASRPAIYAYWRSWRPPPAIVTLADDIRLPWLGLLYWRRRRPAALFLFAPVVLLALVVVTFVATANAKCRLWLGGCFPSLAFFSLPCSPFVCRAFSPAAGRCVRPEWRQRFWQRRSLWRLQKQHHNHLVAIAAAVAAAICSLLAGSAAPPATVAAAAATAVDAAADSWCCSYRCCM